MNSHGSFEGKPSHRASGKFSKTEMQLDRSPSIYERKVVCFVLFCSYEIHGTRMLQIVFLVSLESSGGEGGGGVHGLGSMTFGLVVQKFLNIK
jgi:hypothetical protein